MKKKELLYEEIKSDDKFLDFLIINLLNLLNFNILYMGIMNLLVELNLV